jgi:hypothetical protein
MQALASVVAPVGRFWALMVFGCICFALLLTLSSSSVYAYTVLARMYNVCVEPAVTAGQRLFVLLDFVFRAVTPLWNGFTFFASEVLHRIVLPYSFHNIETLPEMLQGLTLMLVSLARVLEHGRRISWNVLLCMSPYCVFVARVLLLARATALRCSCQCTQSALLARIT